MDSICSPGAELKLLCPLKYFIIFRVNREKGLLSSTTLFCDYIFIKLLFLTSTLFEVTGFFYLFYFSSTIICLVKSVYFCKVNHENMYQTQVIFWTFLEQCISISVCCRSFFLIAAVEFCSLPCLHWIAQTRLLKKSV